MLNKTSKFIMISMFVISGMVLLNNFLNLFI